MGITLDKFLSLGEDEKKFHPLAVKNYRQFVDGIRNDVPLDKLTDEDVKQFLSDWDYGQYEYGVKRLQEWLAKCFLDNPESTLSVYPDSFPFWCTWRFKALLVKVYQRKRERQMLLAAQKEREKRAWLAKIEEQARQERAGREHGQFLKEVNDAINRFKKELAKEKKPKFAYPPALAEYRPDLWCELELPTREEVEKWARPQIQQRVPPALRDFVSWELSWQVQTLPYAEYEVLGVPCLTWSFTILILVKVHLKMAEKEFSKDFEGYSYRMKIGAEDFGFFYLEPALGGDRVGFSIPVVLVYLLRKGDFEAPGIKVLAHGSSSTTFAIQGFEEETVEIHDTFRKFIRDIAKEEPLGEALLGKGLIDKDTAKLVEEKSDQPLPLSGQVSDAGGSDLESVVAKLVEVGWTDADAKKAVENTTFPYGATIEDKVKIILAKSYVNSA